MQSWVKWLSMLSNLETLVTTLVAIFALLGAKHQLKELEKSREAELRPYLSVKYHLLRGRQEAAVLKIYNAGRTSARNIKITFLENEVWHNVKNPNYPFVSGGLSVLNPGETTTYFMGRLTSQSGLVNLKLNPISITIQYEDGITHEAHTDNFTIGLGDQSYLIEK